MKSPTISLSMADEEEKTAKTSYSMNILYSIITRVCYFPFFLKKKDGRTPTITAGKLYTKKYLEYTMPPLILMFLFGKAKVLLCLSMKKLNQAAEFLQ